MTSEGLADWMAMVLGCWELLAGFLFCTFPSFRLGRTAKGERVLFSAAVDY